MTWKQKIFEFSAILPRTTETYSDETMRLFHYSFFKSHSVDWWFIVDEPDLVVVLYKPSYEVWMYQRTK